MKRLFAAAILFALLLSGCARPMPAPAARDLRVPGSGRMDGRGTRQRGAGLGLVDVF